MKPIGKTCIQCGHLKPLTAFHLAPRNRDGRRNDCKACHTAAETLKVRERAEAHRTKWMQIAQRAARAS